MGDDKAIFMVAGHGSDPCLQEMGGGVPREVEEEERVVSPQTVSRGSQEEALRSEAGKGGGSRKRAIRYSIWSRSSQQSARAEIGGERRSRAPCASEC